MNGVKLFEFKQSGDEHGRLVVVEGQKDIPFEIKRIFYIYGTTTNVIRGKHSNLNSEFVLINVCGQSKILIDDGTSREVFILDKPHAGIYIPKLFWKEMYDFSPDSILLVLSSELYDTEEYIRDYNEFVKIIRGDKSNE